MATASTRGLTPTHALRASLPPKSPRYSPQPLSGAAAMADQEREQLSGTSPNPNSIVKDALSGPNTSTSRPRDGPPAATAQMIEPATKDAKLIIPENVTTDNIQTSPVSISSFGSVDNAAPTATSLEPAAAGSLAIDNVPGQDRSTPQNQPPPPGLGVHEPPTNRSFTFPGPIADQNPGLLNRQMSLPMSGYGQNSPKSPSAKRHKCPYCSTDFTRHHNLKSHLLTHSQEKPYECPDCHARFRRLHDLKRHTKLHTGERPHICPKCGRRFARGDALARHNKGQGGCAGRRSSFGVDEDMADAKGDETMDGIEYDDQRLDDSGDVRRVSEPTRRGPSGRQESLQGAYHQHPSTYPPVAAAPHMTNNMRTLFPQGSNSSTRDPPNTLSPKGGSSLSSIHYQTGQPGVFAQGNMTESPKPLSPGQAEQQHQRIGLGESAPLPGGRSPRHPPSMLHQQMTGPGGPSNPGSHSSHGGSGTSIREIIGNDNLWGYIRQMEERTARKEEEYEARIRQLESELSTVKSQLHHRATTQPPAVQPPPQQQPVRPA